MPPRDKKPPAAAATGPAAGRVRRNDPCPCGSGRKHKQCCGGPDAAAARVEHKRAECCGGADAAAARAEDERAAALYAAGRYSDALDAWRYKLAIDERRLPAGRA